MSKKCCILCAAGVFAIGAEIQSLMATGSVDVKGLPRLFVRTLGAPVCMHLTLGECELCMCAGGEYGNIKRLYACMCVHAHAYAGENDRRRVSTHAHACADLCKSVHELRRLASHAQQKNKP